MSNRHRLLACSCVVLIAAGCSQSPTAPTPPAEANGTFNLTAVLSGSGLSLGNTSCAIPAGATIHTVPVPDSSTPMRVWFQTLSPSAGSTVRVGETVRWTFVTDGPTGYFVSVQSGVTAGPSSPYLASSGSATTALRPCSPASATFYGTQMLSSPPFTSGLGRLFVHLKVWIEAGTLVPSGPLPTRPPDYEADEAVGWTLTL